jgi:hypothetical protein
MTLRQSKQSVSHFVQGNYNILMIVLILSYILRPCDYGGLYNSIWKSCLVGAIVFAIFNARHSIKVRSLVVLLAIPSVLFSWFSEFDESKPVVVGIVISTVIFLTVCAIFILKDVMLKARVTLETLRGVVCVYILFAFLFAYLFIAIEVMVPGSILIRGSILPVFPDVTLYFCEMLYFSFGTILTIGFGDIVATKNLSQTVAVMEGIVGQLYIVMLVGRFVSVYSLGNRDKP